MDKQNPMVREALLFLDEIDDIEDFVVKVGTGPEGYLRTAALSHLTSVMGLKKQGRARLPDPVEVLDYWLQKQKELADGSGT